MILICENPDLNFGPPDLSNPDYLHFTVVWELTQSKDCAPCPPFFTLLGAPHSKCGEKEFQQLIWNARSLSVYSACPRY